MFKTLKFILYIEMARPSLFFIIIINITYQICIKILLYMFKFIYLFIIYYLINTLLN